MANVVSATRAEELARADSTPPMRGLVEGMHSRYPIAEQLPAALQEDDFCQRMMSALDEVLAPIFFTLDCWDSYLDPMLAPEDFLDWIGTWIGVDLDETWTTERRRQHIQDAVGLYRMRGTKAALASHIKLYCGTTPVIEESGGCTWSQTAMTPFPGAAHPHMTVKLTLEEGTPINRTTISRIIEESRPAHVPFSVEMTIGGTAAVEAEPVDGEVAADAPGAVALPGSDSILLEPPAPDVPEEYTGPSDIPAVSAPVVDAPGEEAMEGTTPEETPGTETPTGEAPTGEAPTGEAPTGEAPTGEAPAAPDDEPPD